MGGASEEREVSLASGAQVVRALSEAGHEVVAVDTARGVLDPGAVARMAAGGVRDPLPPESRDLLQRGDVAALARDPAIDGVDLIFPVLHGGAGENGTLQALLDLAGLPYAGSGRLGCALAMDKEVSKRLMRAAGIPTPDWRMHPVDLEEVVEALGLPVIVKPPSGGSTLGLTLAHDRDELARGRTEALRYEDRVLYERYVQGRELTVGILGDEPLPVGEIIPAHELFDYECKYRPGLAEEIFPADLPPETARRLQALALEVHRTHFLRDFSRVDFLLDRDGIPWCLEANALPGMTPTSLLPQAAAAAGIPFPELCDRIVRLAVTRTAAAKRREAAMPGPAGTTPDGSG